MINESQIEAWDTQCDLSAKILFKLADSGMSHRSHFKQ